MPLYLVEHHHSGDTCPTKDPDTMLMLGEHVKQKNADTFGIKIHADVVHPGEHRMMMILEAADQQPIDRFMQPFSMVGTVDIKEVTTCEHVVATATC